jgi:hypothetical protein
MGAVVFGRPRRTPASAEDESESAPSEEREALAHSVTRLRGDR